MITNHWGIWVDSNVPTTGVVTNNHVEWLSDEIDKGINLTYEDWKDEQDSLVDDTDPREPESEDDDFLCDEPWDEFESDPSDTILIGDWIIDPVTDKYMANPDGEYAAIVSEIYTQVVWSHNTKRCALCSPCYPGQGDLDTPGDYLAFDLPADMYGDAQ